MHNEVMGWTQIRNAQTHTHGQGKLCMPFGHFMVGA